MLQQTVITGKLESDPEMRYAQDGIAICSLSVAVNTGKDRTFLVTVAAWDKLAEQCGEHLHCGDQVKISGELSDLYVYTDKDGTARARLEMVARVVQSGGKTLWLPYRGPKGLESDSVPFQGAGNESV